MTRTFGILVAAALAACSISVASAQSFSAGYGTGNVLASHYDRNGLIADYAPSMRSAAFGRGRSAFAQAPDPKPGKTMLDPRPYGYAAPGGSIGYNEMLATH